MLKIFKIDLSENYIDFCQKIIKKNYQKYKKIIFISANRRTIRFIAKNINHEEILKVEFFTIEDFVKNLNLGVFYDHSKIERELFFLELIKNYSYELYEKLGGNDAKVFLWAKRLSNLFDEIDRLNADKYLDDFRYIEALEPAKVLLENLKKLYKIYEKEYSKFGYTGKYFKLASEIPVERLSKKFKDSLFIFSGILYLTKPEKKIIEKISSFSDVYFLIHTDLKKRDTYFEWFKVAEKIENELKGELIEICSNSYKLPEIEFFEFPDIHSEASFIADKVKNIIQNEKDINNPNNIGIILPSVSTLYPLLSFLDNKIPINITMGYPFSETDFGIFLNSFFMLLVDIERKKTFACDTKILLRFLNSNIAMMFKDELQLNKLKKNIFSSPSSIYNFDENSPFIKKLVKPFIKIKSFTDLYNAFLSLFELFNKDNLENFSGQTIMFFYNEIVNSLKNFTSNIKIDMVFLYNFMNEIIKDLSIPFEGHPLKGIQILGMLEARFIPFKYIFIADVNEGILPYGDKIDPLLPEIVKKQLGLPLFKDKEQIIRFNFFRMILSASEKVYIIYRSSISGNDKKIKSRYVEQLILKKEFQKEKVHINKSSILLPEIKKENQYIKKEIDLFKNKIFSPSELDLYMHCPYRYYLKKVKNIKPQISFNREFEADIAGRLVHKLFEIAFKNYIGQVIDEKIFFKEIREKILNLISILDKKKFDNDIEKFIKNLSDFQFKALKLILENRINNFFNATEKDFIEFKLIGVEMELKNSDLKIAGFADRVDYIENEDIIRIIDYKTGTYTHFPKSNIPEVKTFDDEALNILKNSVRSIQIPAYILMADEMFKDKKIEAIVYHLGKKKDEMVKKICYDNLDIFKKVICFLINHIKNSEYFYALPDENCKYCEYFRFCKFA